MSEINETVILRIYTNSEGVLEEFEVPVKYRVEHKYYGCSGEDDDPSECYITELAKVCEDTGPFKKGDMIVLSDEDRERLASEELWGSN